MKRKIGRVIIAVAAVLVVLSVGMSAFIGLQVFEGSTQLTTNQETTGVPDGLWETYRMDAERFHNTYQLEQIALPSSREDHAIPADYLYAVEARGSKNHPTVVLVHGMGDNRYSNYPMAEFFLTKGYNVVTYDQRSTNQNTVRYTTFGYREKYDLIDWVHYIKQQAPGQTIGIWGASYGGATAGLALAEPGMDERVDFLILDCPVSSMAWMVEQEMARMDIGIPVRYMAWCGNILTKLKLGFTYQDADVPSAMRGLNTPVLIIHSEADLVTPAFMGRDIYGALSENNGELWTVKDSEHCWIWLDYNSEYRDQVERFLAKHQ